MNRKNINIVIILVIIVIVIFLGLGFLGIGGFNLGLQQPAASTAASGPQALLDEVQKNGSVTELKVADIEVGTGDAIAPGDTIEVSYTGILPNGTVFDSTEAHGGVPLTLVVGTDGSLQLSTGGGLIAGWSQGMAGMKEGGSRLLAIPPQLGYGQTGQGSIPPNATLIFQVEIVKRIPAAGVAPATGN